MANAPLTQKLYLDFGPMPPAATRKRRMVWTQRLRRLSQIGFAGFIIYGSVIHNLATVDGAVPSLDALCPFGGIETAWQYLSSGGAFVPKTHLSNLVLLFGLGLGVLLAGGAFCGWICPFGTIQDFMGGLRARLRLPEVRVPARLDRILRYGRFVVLALILYNTIASVKLWFADYDPYRTLFGLGWLFEFDWATQWIAYAIVLVILGASLFVERAWCRYACPLGGAISAAGHLSLLRIRRDGDACKGCSVCEAPCPVKLPVATARTVSPNCIGCLACVEACPRKGALELRVAPAWWDGLRGLWRRIRPAQEVPHAH